MRISIRCGISANNIYVSVVVVQTEFLNFHSRTLVNLKVTIGKCSIFRSLEVSKSTEMYLHMYVQECTSLKNIPMPKVVSQSCLLFVFISLSNFHITSYIFICIYICIFTCKPGIVWETKYAKSTHLFMCRSTNVHMFI